MSASPHPDNGDPHTPAHTSPGRARHTPDAHADDPTRPAQATPQQLPADVPGFVNRQTELAILDAVLGAPGVEPPTSGVYVLAGTAGVGKTSLAIHWAHRVRDHFPDGQLCVNLRGYDPGTPLTATEVLDRFLRALDVPAPAIPADPEDRASLYRTLLAGRRMLILLDNAATPAQIRPLLPGTNGSLVIVTSRNRLSGLAARDGARRLTLDLLTETDAVGLLRTLTTAYRPDDDTTASYEELARLCARLPLALRIAAERAASRPRMPLADLIRDLRDESALWDALTADDSDEADAVRTVFAWSYRALTAPAARLFRLLGLHPGAEFSAEVAAAIADTTLTTARQQLDALVGAHLIEQTAADRYQFHDLLRAYAISQTQDEPPDQRHATQRRALTWYLHAANTAEDHIGGLDLRLPLDPPHGLPPPPITDRHTATRWLEVERGNLLAAVRTAAADPALHDLAWQLPTVLRGHYMRNALYEDWFTATTLGLHAATTLGDHHGEAELHDSLGIAHLSRFDIDNALHHHTEALTRRRTLGQPLPTGASLNALGLTALRARRLTDAIVYFQDAHALFHNIGEMDWAATALANLGEAEYESDNLDAAASTVTRALAGLHATKNVFGQGNALRLLSAIQRRQGHLDQSLLSAQAAVDIAVSHDSPIRHGVWLIELGTTQAATGHLDDALISLQHAATIHRRFGDRSREATAIRGAGDVLRAMDRPDDAADMYRGALTILRTTNDTWQTALTLDRLADVLATRKNLPQAHSTWREAHHLLERFTDRQARRLADQISQHLT